jgi:uncharacterized protein YecT (DUF1311 family)
MKTVTVLLLFLWIVPSIRSEADESKCCCTTYDTSVCLSKVRSKVDAELTITYSSALEETKDSTVDMANLKIAERKWIAYRDATCKAEYGLWDGASGGPNGFDICIIRITRIRIFDLKNAYLACHPHCKQASRMVPDVNPPIIQ